MFYLSLFLFCIVACSPNPKANANIGMATVAYNNQLAIDTPSAILKGIEKNINTAFVECIITNNSEPLQTLQTQLAALYDQKSQNIIQYWRAYLLYYQAIYHLQTNENKAAEKATDKAINLLSDLDNKNSEDYALLSLLQGFSIQFKGMRAMFIASSVKKNAKKAIALDGANPRGYFVYGNSDFYTPEKYGGGKEVETYLLKAIALPSQAVENSYLPSWGVEEAYELLVRWYIKKEDWTAAKQYYQQGIEAYPDSYQLNQLAGKLVGK